MKILYEDSAITVAQKPPELLSEQTPNQTGLADLLAQRNRDGYVGTIHRLDRGVGGVMVYARTPRAAATLSAAVARHEMEKDYLAVVHGIPQKESDTLKDLLYHDRTRNKTFVVTRERRGVKEASLEYRVLETCVSPDGEPLSLLLIRLHTGRTHQIRVQFSSRGHALVGDGKYGAHDHCPVALFCHRLTFRHPVNEKPLTFSALPHGEVWQAFRNAYGQLDAASDSAE